ncbi:hypothetical protein [Promicromonospora sp. NPDC090134]|uniref:hypothetical protein n=1 Tax=Promicromonospora sp. NPDC090134 TaxID=3364408 RepID=UPI00381D3D9E
MHRVSVVGAAGSGKSTFARRLAARLDVRHVELVMAQVYRRTLSLAVSRAELWPGTGNRQPWGDALAPWREGTIVRWSWDQRKSHPERYGAAMTDPANAHLTFHRLRSRREADAFLERAALG